MVQSLNSDTKNLFGDSMLISTLENKAFHLNKNK
jgi:hypothetical protein